MVVLNYLGSRYFTLFNGLFISVLQCLNSLKVQDRRKDKKEYIKYPISFRLILKNRKIVPSTSDEVLFKRIGYIVGSRIRSKDPKVNFLTYIHSRSQ